MKVTEIETHEIALEYEDWIAYPLDHYNPSPHRTIYVAHTDNGLMGLGESNSTEPGEVVEKYIESNPFDWMGDETSLGLGTAMYDLMGKAAGVPVYKLIGQKYRSWVPVGSWTVSTHPKHMAEAVEWYSARGYTWLKYHLSPFENVFDQIEAMQAVAPAGFKIHFDFTMHGTDDHTFQLLTKMAGYPIAGCFEDPLPAHDLPGYVELRKRSPLPIVLHQAGIGHTYDVYMGAADAYMLGHSDIGNAIRRAGLFAVGNIPFNLQNVGGNITRSMVTHMMAAFPSAHFHFVSGTEIWKSDVVNERLEPVNGFVRVSEGPGLGLALNRDELERLKSIPRPEQRPWIIKSVFKNGVRMFHITGTKGGTSLVMPVLARHIPMSYDSPISTEYWDDDGTSEYRQMYERIEREGTVLEREE